MNQFKQPNNPFSAAQTRPTTGTSAIATNKVLRNTYLLLSMTLIFSSITAGVAMAMNATFVNIWLALAVIIGFPFLLNKMRNSPMAIVLAFAYTGFLGWYIGPVLNMYIKSFSNGSELIMMALGSTGLIFLILSSIALKPSRNFSHWGRFLFIGISVAFVAMLVNVFFLHLPMLQLGISVVFAFISGGYIMYMTNSIIHGGETNYIVATVVIFVSLMNIFLTLLQVFALFGGSSRN